MDIPINWDLLKQLILDYGNKIIIAISVLFVARYLINIIKGSLEDFLKKSKTMPALRTLVVDLINFILWALTIALALNILGLRQISLAIGGSVAFLGIGMAKSVSSVTGDLISGVFLIIDDDFKIGAKVKTNGVSGIIESLDIRKTKIRDSDGNVYVIPNKKVDDNILIIEEYSDKTGDK